ncbi:MAG: hypothetical protein H0W16_13825 [Actinobacteria bacterium]|nr:hypothetical protein [Actinomycetota bacterium]
MNHPVEMGAPVAPPSDVHATDLAHRVDCPLDPDDQWAELGREVRREVAEVAVLARLEDDEHGQSARLLERRHVPAFVAPDRLPVAVPAAPAVARVLWRAHISFFVDYTVALAKKNKAGQNKAVANLTTYTKMHGAFLAGATGLPKLAVQNDLLGHVLELKNQLDAYNAGNYTKAANLYRDAYAHMFMTGDLLSGAIAKQKSLR